MINLTTYQLSEYKRLRRRERRAPNDALRIARNAETSSGFAVYTFGPVTRLNTAYTRRWCEIDECGARRVANWPDATDEDLTAARDVLEKKLAERLPALLERFHADMHACGFVSIGGAS